MCVHVSTLPDDCLLCIFDRIPLVDLLTLNRVCKRWKCLLPSACARRRTLVLIGGGGDIELHRTKFHIPFNSSFDVSFEGGQPYFGLPAVERDNALTLPSSLDFHNDRRTDDELTELDRVHRARLSGQLAPYLTALFPNVDRLVVIYPENRDDHELHLVSQLVGSNWSLKILKLWLGGGYTTYWSLYRLDQNPIRTLLRAIPRQSASLQKLTLDGGGMIDDGHDDGDYGGVVDDEEANDAPVGSRPLFSFISQLKEVKLYLNIYSVRYSILDIMHRFGSAQSMQNIGLGDYGDLGSVATVLNPKFEFTTKVSQFYVMMHFESVEQFSEFCGRFGALTSLWMFWPPDEITFTKLVANLASLVLLTHLHLFIDFDNQAENVFDRVDGEERQISALARVKVLELSIAKRSHDDFESLSPLVFPSVEVIILRFIAVLGHHYSTQCIICRPHEDDGDDEPSNIHDVIDRCRRLTILSLKSKFTNNPRLYADSLGPNFVDCTDYVRTEEDALPVIGR